MPETRYTVYADIFRKWDYYSVMPKQEQTIRNEGNVTSCISAAAHFLQVSQNCWLCLKLFFYLF